MSEILRVIDELATGFAGTIAVSGLPQREDHCLVVGSRSRIPGRDISDISLSQGRTPFDTSIEPHWKNVSRSPLPDSF